MPLDDFAHANLVPQIQFFEDVFGMVGDRGQVGQVPGVSQAVEIDQAIDFRPVYDVTDDIAANEPRAACHKQVHSASGTPRQRASQSASPSSDNRASSWRNIF